jgi:hypothetical protein
MIDLLIFLFALLQMAFVYGFYRMYMAHWEHAARITRLETRQPVKPEPKAPERVQVKQIFEKPVVKNAKEVKPLEIGDGRMRFDAEAQIAEWI